jgi:hypothetical protein
MAAPAVAWFEVTGKDGAALQSFYGELFDWKIQDAGDGSGGTRTAQLRAQGGGKLPIICPATDDSDWAGIGIFNATPEEVDRIMQDDPGVKAACLPTSFTPSAASQPPACRRARSSPGAESIAFAPAAPEATLAITPAPTRLVRMPLWNEPVRRPHLRSVPRSERSRFLDIGRPALEDPDRVLEGEGSQTRHVAVRAAEDRLAATVGHLVCDCRGRAPLPSLSDLTRVCPGDSCAAGLRASRSTAVL